MTIFFTFFKIFEDNIFLTNACPKEPVPPVIRSDLFFEHLIFDFSLILSFVLNLLYYQYLEHHIFCEDNM